MAMPIAGEEHLYQYAIVRGDLNMPPGKLAAQAGHAYTDSLIDALAKDPPRVSAYRNRVSGGSKITVKARTVAHLLAAYNEAKRRGLPCSLVVDQHHVLPPHFTGEPIITAVGIGPCTRAECADITKKFRCV